MPHIYPVSPETMAPPPQEVLNSSLRSNDIGPDQAGPCWDQNAKEKGENFSDEGEEVRDSGWRESDPTPIVGIYSPL